MPTDTTTFSGSFQDVMVISELRGAYPNVPISSDVDYEALIAGDSDPVFVTLPIGKVNVKSGNGRYYDEEFVMELMRQTLTNKPVGLMGHMSNDERATAFKPEAIHWVGAVRDGDLVWGKGYVVGEARDRIRRYKAQGKTIATSIDAHADGKWSEALGAYHMDAKTLRLSQIDLAPSDRAGIPSLAVVPHITKEIQQVDQGVTTVDKYQVIREMTPEDAKLLPDIVRDAVLASVAPPALAPEIVLVSEVRSILGLDAGADLTKAITELRQAETERKQQAIKDRITELAKEVKFDLVRELVIELVTARQPATVQDAEAGYKAVVEMESVKKALAGQLQETMGPRQGTPVAGQAGANRYFNIPKKEAAAAQ